MAMSTRTLPEANPSPADPPRRERHPGYHPAVPALASALLLWFAFPPADRGYLAWFALAPLFWLIRSERSRRSIYAGAWLGGLVHWLLAVEWVRLTDPSAWLAWVVLALVLSLWWPAFLLIARPAVRTLRLPLLIAAPTTWVALEYVRAHILTGLPWYYLAHTQYRYLPLIQVVDVTGMWGLSFLVAMANALWVDLLSLPLYRPTARGPRPSPAQLGRVGVMAALLVATLAYGAYRLGTARFRPGPRVALLQSNFPQALKMSLKPTEITATYQKMADRSLHERPDLIVWPETSYPRGFTVIDPEIDEAVFERQVRDLHPDGSTAGWRQDRQNVKVEINDWVDTRKVPMVVGSITYQFGTEGFAKYNSALLFAPGTEEVARYDKLHLVPFGEYVPLIETFPWLTVLTPYQGRSVPSLAFGSAIKGFDWGGIRYAAAICFEDTVPHVVRRFFAEVPPSQQPDVLLNLSNDGWFHGSSEHDMHLAISVFRAVENRVPLARAVNMGVSAVVDGNGAILRSLPKATAGVLVAAVPLDDRTSLYTAWGDWFARACLAVSIGLVVLLLVPARWRSPLRSAISPRLPRARA